MTMTKQIVAIGRAAIDLNAIEINRPMEETTSFTKYVGGSPANIMIGSAKLGLDVGLIANVSNDQHGNFIIKYLNSVGVDTSQIHIDKNGHKSGLTFTEILSSEESNILMYRENVADLYLSPQQVNEEYIKKFEYLLISGVALSKSPSREAVLKALEIAKSNDVKVIFELDFRPYTWSTDEETSIYYELVAKQSNIVIGTRDEFDMIKKFKKIKDVEISEELFKYHDCNLIVIKHGVKGSNAFTKNGKQYKGEAYKAEVVKSFGAGDSYASAFLYALIKFNDIEKALKYGAASAAIVVSSHSSSEAMPTVENIEKLIREQS